MKSTRIVPSVLSTVLLLGCGDDGASASSSTSGTDDSSGSSSESSDTAATDTGDATGDPGTDTGDTGDTGDPELPHFSFFVTSLRAMQELSGNEQGFGGDLRYGETGPGAGLRGADKICAAIAERSMVGASAKQWRAFLSATADENGQVVHAIDRVGNGPWYDRIGRVVALTREDLLTERPTNIDPTIKDDLPNEDGVPNHKPDPTQPEVDNHDTLTGTNENGQLYGASSTCLDWTSAVGDLSLEGRPRVGHSWPRYGGPMMGGDGSMANWMSSLDESGCAPGVNLIEMGPPDPESNTVGSGGGYGGIYCFALTP